MSIQPLQSKQQFLLKQIIEQDYDPEQFQQFMANEKGLDLNEYTLKQLRNIVRQFKGSVIGRQQDVEEDNANTEHAFIESSQQPVYEDKKEQKQVQKVEEKPNKVVNNPLNNTNKVQDVPKTKPIQQKSINATNDKKPKINVKQMVIPQFKGFNSNKGAEEKKQTQPNTSSQQNSISPPTKTIQPQAKLNQNSTNSSKTQEKLKSLQPLNKISQKPLSKTSTQQPKQNLTQKRDYQIKKEQQKKSFATNKMELDQQQYVYDRQQAFIQSSSHTDYNGKESVRQSMYIPAAGKNLYTLIKKSSSSSLYKLIKSQKGLLDSFAIKIPSFAKKQSNSLFRFSYISYNIETTFQIISTNQKNSNMKGQQFITQTKKWKVQRRFNDFKWLFEYLKKYYVGLLVPPIPSKTKMRSFEDQHLEQRMICFERFLNKCMHIEEISSDPLVQSFLSIESRQQFQAVKKKFQNKLKSKDQNLLQYLKGQQILFCKQGNISVPPKVKTNIVNVNDLLIALNNELKQLDFHLHSASQKAISANSIFRQISQIQKSSNEFKGSSIYDLMGQFIGQLGNKLDNQVYYLKNYVQNIWMYEQKYYENLLYKIGSLQKNRTMIQTKFSENTSRNTDQYKKTKQLYDINLALTFQQISRHKRQDSCLIAKEFSSGISKYVNLIKQEMMTGVDLVTKAMTIAQGKQLKQVQLISKKLPRKRSQERIALQEE